MPVKIGIGRKRIARSVMMLTGAEERYNTTIYWQWSMAGTGVLKAALTGLHWKAFKNVNAMPAKLTTARVARVAHLNIFSVFERFR